MGWAWFTKFNTKTGQLCALKMVLPENMREEADRLRFKREFRAMQRVDHPNVVRVYESGSERNRPYFTMELIQERHCLNGLTKAKS